MFSVPFMSIMSDCYFLYSKFSGLTLSMRIRNFGPNILRYFQIKKVFIF